MGPVLDRYTFVVYVNVWMVVVRLCGLYGGLNLRDLRVRIREALAERLAARFTIAHVPFFYFYVFTIAHVPNGFPGDSL